MISKIVAFVSVLILGTTALSAQESTDSYAFDRTSHDFGVLKSNETGTAVFKLTNQGTTPLVLLDVKVSCNCAKIDWPKQPIPPGESADLTVTYKDRDPGAFYKVVEVTTNGIPRRAQIRLKGTIEK